MELPDWLKTRNIAHRGLHGPEIVENSIEAFDAAIVANLPIELDVRFCQNGVPVVFHDESLFRIFGRKQSLSDVNEDFLVFLRYWPKGGHLLKLQECLEHINGRVPLLIEIKPPPKGGQFPLEKITELLNEYKGDFAFQSFSPIELSKLRGIGRDFILGFLICDWWKQNLSLSEKIYLSTCWRKMNKVVDFFSVEKSLLGSSTIRAVRKYYKKPLIGWTITSSKELEDLSELADNFICENFSF